METHVLNGKVTDAGGKPLPDVTVTIATSPEPVQEIAALTNEKGEFAFDGLVYGAYELRFVKAETSVLKKLKFKEDDEVLVFVLP